MLREDAATLKPGDWLEYILDVQRENNGSIHTTSVMAVFVKHASNHRIVIRPEFTDRAWNRARSVNIANVRDHRPQVVIDVRRREAKEAQS